jgi:hypothetical protein
MFEALQLRTVEVMCRAYWPAQQRPTEARRATSEEAVMSPKGRGQN